MPAAKTSKFDPSISERRTAPWFGYAQRRPDLSVTLKPMSPTSQYSRPSGPCITPEMPCPANAGCVL